MGRWNFNKWFGMRVKTLREDRGWTVRELAEKMAVPPRLIGLWEDAHADPDLSDIVRLADIFGMPVSTLLNVTLSPAPAREGT